MEYLLVKDSGVTHEDLRVTRTRELIERSFYELLMEKSLHKLTVGEIAERARINRATFYAHYEDKYDLYRHLVSGTFAQILGTNLESAGADKEAQLRALVRAACVFFEKLNSTCPPVDRQTRPLVEVEVQRQIHNAVLRLIRADAPAMPEMTARMVSWAIWGAGLDWEGSQGSLNTHMEQIHAVVVKMTSA